MKGKRLVNLSLIAMLVLSMVIAMVPVRAGEPSPGTGTTIWVDDSEASNIINNANLTCTYDFNVRVYVWNVSNAATLAFKLSYNDTLLNATSAIPGPYFGWPINATRVNQILPQVGGQWVWWYTGYVWTGFVLNSGYELTNTTGSTLLLTITFHIMFAPEQDYIEDHWVNCSLHLYDTELYAPGAVWIDHSTTDGQYKYTRPMLVAGAPHADFTYLPLFPYVCDTVTLTSTSTPNGGVISAYLWTISGPATLTGANDTAVTTMHCDGPGDVDVTLTVWDDEGMNDTITKTIPQSVKPAGIIDLYTSDNRFCGQITPNVGGGPTVFPVSARLNLPCDALTDDVNITLYANVSWGEAPVMHVLVAFEVWWNWSRDWSRQDLAPVFKNECVLYRTAETDKDGIAQIWFRVPRPCTGPMHGKWVAIATCKVQEVKIQDTMPFDVGWLITLTKFPALYTFQSEYIRDNPPSHGPECIGFNVTLKNIAWITKEVVIIAVAYDDCDVPIGQVIIPLDITGGIYCSPHEESIIVTCQLPVPQWAYVGTGKLYVSAFTRLPRDCGVAYCPEVSTTFLIKYVP